MAQADQPAPVLSVVAGRPDEAETAAVTVVILAVLSEAGLRPEGRPGGRRYQWSDRSRLLRPAVSAGPGAWRASALPR
jgi:hypothetical protein